MSAWLCRSAFAGNPAHVIPVDDLKEHDADSETCWCRPFWDGEVLVHNAMDRREEYEQGRKAS